MASFWFNEGRQEVDKNTIDLDNDDFRMLLLDNGGAYTPSRTTTFIDTGGANDIVDDEVTVGAVPSYVRQALANEAINISANLIRWFSDNVAFGVLETGATLTAAVIFKFNAVDTLARPMVFSDFTDIATNGSTVTVNQPANGWGHGDTT